jgi:aspartate carbamoyltransferase catalytic subunit
MHPGPMIRGLEITSEVADGAQSVIAQQVRNGVAIRMALIDRALQAKGPVSPAPVPHLEKAQKPAGKRGRA